MPELSPGHVDALWAKGILWWKLRPIQRIMYQREAENNRLTWVENCSRRLGKSYTNAIRAIETATQIPHAVIPFAAPTHKMLRAINIPIFKQICEDAPPDVRPIWKPSSGFFQFNHNGSEIPLAGVNNGHSDDLRGREAHRFFIDEAGFVDDLEYLVESVAMPQLLTTDGKLNMSSSPSRTPAHAFAKYCHQAQISGNYAEYDIDQSGYPADLIARFRQEANGPEWKEGDPDSSTWLREYKCQFVVDENFAIVREWKKEFEEEVPKDKYFQFYHLYEGMDMGVVDKTVVLFGYYDFLKSCLVVEDEVVMSGPSMTTRKLADAIRAKQKALWMDRKVIKRIADNNNPMMLLDLASMEKMPFSPTQKTGKTERQTILEAMVNELRINVSMGKVRVHPRCKQLIGCLRYGIWNEKRTTFATSSVYGHYDAIAALIYLNRNIDRVTNPIPPTFEISENSSYVDPNFGKNKNHETIRKIFNLKRKR